jgi:alpha-glucuronidase
VRNAYARLVILNELQDWVDKERDDAKLGEACFEPRDPMVVRGVALKHVSQKIDELKARVESSLKP